MEVKLGLSYTEKGIHGGISEDRVLRKNLDIRRRLQKKSLV